MTETKEQTAAKCVARLFQGWGHEIRKKQSGMSYGKEGSDKLTEFEKNVLKQAFDFFMELMERKE